MIKPKKILGLPINYIDMTGSDTDGEFKDGTVKQSINIHKDLSDVETKIILAHELIHYAFAKSGFSSVLHSLSNGTDALEEGAVVAIQNQLIATGVLVLNPALFKKGKR